MKGWIKMNRKIAEWEWYSDIKVCRLFIHMLLKANHAPGRWQGIDILPGQLIIGRSSLSEETGLSEQEIRTVMSKLKSTGEITSKATNKFTVITICKYSEYQGCGIEEQPANQPASQPTSNQQSTTNKNNKNATKEEKELSASPAPEGAKRNGIPYKEIIDKLNEVCGTSYQHSTKATQQLIKARFNEGRTVEDFHAVIDSRAALWLTDEKMLQYLRPSTLFGSKFEGYLVAARGGVKPKQKGRGTCAQCANNYLPRCKAKSEEERARCNHFAEVEA
jgi:uncharacterized phage protein (TIGR02220 family)